MSQTKIICTIGPSVNSVEKILELIDAGMSVARINFSHATHADHLETINRVKAARKQAGKPIGIMLDTKGPEIRLGKVPAEGISVQPKDRLWLTESPTSDGIAVTPGYVLDLIEENTPILIDDGYIQSHVIKKEKGKLQIEIENYGTIFSSKGVNVPNVDLKLPVLTDKDVEDIVFGLKNDIDIIAASFVRSAEHVLEIKKLLMRENRPDVTILAKIENAEGIQNFDSIVQIADGIMIARGDLGVEVPLSQVPKLQKMMIRKCYMLGKPSVTATQMLESMIKNPRPTRAEASDVANAIYDGTSAVMLSGETAVGKYPIDAVKIMKSIVKEAEDDFKYRDFFEQHAKQEYHDIPSAITLATVKTAYTLGAKAIFAFTSGGGTVRLLSRLRPQMPIVAFTPNERSYYQLSINWGVIPVHCSDCKSHNEMLKEASDYALEKKIVSYGDLIVVTSGLPFGVRGTTNTLRVESIGDVLVRGEKGFGEKVHATIALMASSDTKKPYEVQGHVLVISSYDESFEPFVQEAKAVILQNDHEDTVSEKKLLKATKQYLKPVIVKADGAFRTLRESQLITLDPEKALVYKGVV